MTDPQQDGASERARTDASGTRLRWVALLASALVAVVALALIVGALVSLRPRAAEARSEDDARSAVTRAAERFTVRFNTYDATDSGSLTSYRGSVDAMMSPKFRSGYTDAMGQLTQTIEQAKVVSRGKVLASAVSSLDADSAKVLVVSDADVATVYDKNVARHFRWEISLVKINGKWLVDDFQPVA